MPTQNKDRHHEQAYFNNLIVRRQKPEIFVILHSKPKENRWISLGYKKTNLQKAQYTISAYRIFSPQKHNCI
jgi:hypothetical protein